jgi:hypothetical protein
MNAKNIIKNLKLYEDLEYCSFDVPMIPLEIISWRGSYSEPAIVCTTSSNYPKTSVKEWIEFFEKIEGTTVTGYKGGTFTLSENDDIWLVSGPSNVHHCGISHITCVDNFEVIIHTCYQKV